MYPTFSGQTFLLFKSTKEKKTNTVILNHIESSHETSRVQQHSINAFLKVDGEKCGSCKVLMWRFQGLSFSKYFLKIKA